MSRKAGSSLPKTFAPSTCGGEPAGIPVYRGCLRRAWAGPTAREGRCSGRRVCYRGTHRIATRGGAPFAAGAHRTVGGSSRPVPSGVRPRRGGQNRNCPTYRPPCRRVQVPLIFGQVIGASPGAGRLSSVDARHDSGSRRSLPADVKKRLVKDDASPFGGNRGYADVPGRLKCPPPRTDFGLPGFADMKQRSVLDPLGGHRPDQVIDAE